LQQDLESQLFDAGVRLLARREHSAKELSLKLQQKFNRCDALNSQLEAVIERLQDLGYQSDERFAESYARSRQAKGFGADRIALELGEKGVAEVFIQQALSGLASAWLDVIYHVWKKKFKSTPESYSERAKQQQFLRYRGFRSDDIAQLFAVLSESLDD